VTMARQLLSLRVPVVVYWIAIVIAILPWTTRTTALTPAVTPITIAGVRCLVAPCTSFRTGKEDLDEASKSKSSQLSQRQPPPPPLIIVPGMAQSLAMYEAHAASISRTRSCLVVEPLGLGIDMTERNSRDMNVTLPAQAVAVMVCAVSAFPDASVFSIAGFSLGGRIAMAAACLYPDQIKFLHLTGVAWERSDSGKIALAAWKFLLQQDNLRGFAWSAVQTTYSSQFLLRNQDRLVDWVDTVTASQTVKGLTAILEQTHPVDDVSDPWSVPSMAVTLRARAVPIRGDLLIGADDNIVSVATCQQLAESLQWAAPVAVPDVGHCVPMEAPRVWRQHLLDSLDYA
jgi:pimeloyl-ACP methyl ester carboxylesterase